MGISNSLGRENFSLWVIVLICCVDECRIRKSSPSRSQWPKRSFAWWLEEIRILKTWHSPFTLLIIPPASGTVLEFTRDSTVTHLYLGAEYGKQTVDWGLRLQWFRPICVIDVPLTSHSGSSKKSPHFLWFAKKNSDAIIFSVCWCPTEVTKSLFSLGKTRMIF